MDLILRDDSEPSTKAGPAKHEHDSRSSRSREEQHGHPQRTTAKYDLEMVLPAINEEQRIGPTIGALCHHLARRPLRSRVIVVDNGSVDATADVVDRADKHGVPVDVVGCRTRGKGAAVRTGVMLTTAPLVGYCDADSSTPPAVLDRAVELVQSGSEVVVGSRRCEGAAYVVPQSALRRLGSRGFHLLAARMVGPISDSQCGFKLMDGDVARSLFTDSTVDGFAFDVEILAWAHRRRLSVHEVPVHWTDQDGSTFRLVKDGVRAFRDLRTVNRSLRATVRRGPR
jgi:glycosyltransferase involved in cell wall biosynthesis